jgi:zinc protease
MAERALPEVRRSEVGGVPVFWADAPRPYEVQLLFRVGRADETLATSGITHLVEHLAMPSEPVPLDCNVFVSYLTTGFWARGETPDLREFVTAVAARIRDVPLGRMEVEREILLAEEDLGYTAEAVFLCRRFGATGFGLIGFPELGLRRLDQEAVSDWARLRFTRDNAALVLSGPHADLELELPGGPRHCAPEPRPLATVKLPSFLSWSAPAVSLNLLVRREPVGEVAAEVLRSRAARRLRFETGHVYGVEVSGVPLTAELASVTLHANCRSERAAAVRDALLTLLDELADAGPTADELVAAASVVQTRIASPAATAELLHQHAYEHLVGLPWEPAADSYARLDGLTAPEVEMILAQALETALLALPGELDADGSRFGASPESPDDRPVTGREFRRRGAFLGPARQERFVVGKNGVTHLLPGRESITVRWATCAAVTAWRNGVRCLWGESGFLLYLWPDLWRHGAKATELVDELAPRGVVVDMGDDPPPTPF